MITVATWNLLHRVHAENWDEGTIRRWPDEAARIAAITAVLAARTEQVIALQEVSGDQLTSLRAALPRRAVHAFRYPRVPTPRRGRDLLHDRTEHLVLLTDGPSTRIGADAFADDKGKGALAVRVGGDADGTLVIATHVSGDRRRTGQLAHLAALAGPTTVLLGDFNTTGDTIEAGLGEGFTAARFTADSTPTRPGQSRGFIDHVVTRGATASTATVEDPGGLSDHNIVHATITTPRDRRPRAGSASNATRET
ncbi:endonuclease/exonuclease/phosphatase family protein [Actinophytocola glycyrrhizae]|uniref:Endonuclease/exonuclease/phosphatase family protein n=1 Tax=Actinophytocola glycyrrhizae TaxID=2044873 RepID=A0ABV9SEF2_9PSEU